jgi:hypothetical protein
MKRSFSDGKFSSHLSNQDEGINFLRFNAEVTKLRRLHFNWTLIANELGTNYRSLLRWRQKTGYNDSWEYSAMDEANLDREVSKLIEGQPHRGVIDVKSRLEFKSIHVPRSRLRQSLERLDIEERINRFDNRQMYSFKKIADVFIRKRTTVERRVYAAIAPHNVWHIDGHHKLIKFGLVVHSGIDGFTHLVTFLHCSNNNRAATVKDLFVAAVTEYGIPAKIRCDKGLKMWT